MAVSALGAGAAAASAADTTSYLGSAGATSAYLLGGAVYSDPTARSEMATGEVPAATSNNLVGVDVRGLAKVGVATTSISTSRSGTATSITSVARLADVVLLGGLIRATGVESTATVTKQNGIAQYASDAKLASLTVGNSTVPLEPAANTTIQIPGVASVTLRKTSGTHNGDARASVDVTAIEVTLLGAYGSAPAGTTIDLSTVHAQIGNRAPLVGAAVGGSGAAAFADLGLGSLLQFNVGRLAATSVPPGGTGAAPVTNTTLGVELPGLVSAQAAWTAAMGSVKAGALSRLGICPHRDLRLLGGLITANVLDDQVTVPANTVVTIPGVANVVINERSRTATGETQSILHITVTGVGLGLPLGAQITVGYTNAWVRTAG